MTDRVALVTGGTRGIGHVDRVMTVQGNSADAAHRRPTINAIVERFGHLNVLVHNADANPVMGSMIDLDDAAAQKILALNFPASLGWAGEMYRVHDRSRDGALVNVSAICHHPPLAGHWHVWGLRGRAHPAHQAVGAGDGPQYPSQCRNSRTNRGRIRERTLPRSQRSDRGNLSAWRIGSPDDVAYAVSFLGAGEAGWITGETLLLDDGLLLIGGIG